ncbi:hypothetical protein LJR028_004012 [Rhizobacter sp. LjRoot28]
MLLALGLYIYDSLLLLRPDELALVRIRSGWRPRFGAHAWKLRGHEPFLPHPLTPWRAVFRVKWSFERGFDSAESGVLPEFDACGRAPRVGVVLLLLLMFAAMPIALFAPATAAQTVAVFAAIYVTCAVVLIGLRRDAVRCGMHRSAFWKLCIECMACPPFCINAVRRVTLAAGAGAGVSLEGVRCGLADSDEVALLRRQLLRRVREQIDLEPEASARMARLQRVAGTLQPEENE